MIIDPKEWEYGCVVRINIGDREIAKFLVDINTKEVSYEDVQNVFVSFAKVAWNNISNQNEGRI